MVYVDDKECQAAVLRISDGTSLKIKEVYLLDENNHAIDPSCFADHVSVKVSGVEGFMQVNDANGGFTTPVKGMMGAENPAIAIHHIVLSSGESVQLRLAVASLPTTRP